MEELLIQELQLKVIDIDGLGKCSQKEECLPSRETLDLYGMKMMAIFYSKDLQLHPLFWKRKEKECFWCSFKF